MVKYILKFNAIHTLFPYGIMCLNLHDESLLYFKLPFTCLDLIFNLVMDLNISVTYSLDPNLLYGYLYV